MLRNQMLGNSIADVVHRIKRIRLEELFLACASARAGAAFLWLVLRYFENVKYY